LNSNFRISNKSHVSQGTVEKNHEDDKDYQEDKLAVYWSNEVDKVAQQLHSSLEHGLTTYEAEIRLKEHGKNLLTHRKSLTWVHLLLSQFKSPIILIFIAAATLSYFLEDAQDAIIILSIIFISAGLGFWQENGAANAIRKLLLIVKTRATVVRDGKEKEVLAEEIVIGDIVILRAGDGIPGDCYIINSRDLFANESFLTGESYPVEKATEGRSLSVDTPLPKRTNTLLMGSYVTSGKAKAIVVKTGSKTELGKISSHLQTKRTETDFERGVRRFGYFLAEITLLLVIANFTINMFLHRAVLDSFLFSLALAIGLTPQLLPAIISVNLAHGAKKMASKNVIVKRLDSIENLGSMNILCSDKTGTLTAGIIELHSAIDITGEKNDKVLLYAYLNSINESGFVNPIDQAITRTGKKIQGLDTSGFEKLDEIPYDFGRKRLSVLLGKKFAKDEKAGNNLVFVGDHDHHLLITKGALYNILDSCSTVETSNKIIELDAGHRQAIGNIFEQLSSKGLRVLGLSYRHFDATINQVTKADENESTFLGFLVLWDPVRDDATKSIAALEELGISLKLISGDNKLIASYVGEKVGLRGSHLLTGSEIDMMSPEAFENRIKDIDIFAEVEPRQKERIIQALRKRPENVVGYIGDGINDAPALHASDIGISVDTATDVVKEEADLVLLGKDLNVLAEGVKEGRKTFANTSKYVFMATSANFGNMFSTAVASFFLPFIPMLPKQILFNNILTDLQEMTIATDTVDRELISRPRRWDINLIRRFMIVFGTLSAAFDFTMFAILLFVLHPSIDQFRTAWFIESVVSASLVVLIVRTPKPTIRSRPSKYLLLSTCIISGIALVIPLSPIGVLFSMVKLSTQFYGWIFAVVICYIISAELVKRFFYRLNTHVS